MDITDGLAVTAIMNTRPIMADTGGEDFMMAAVTGAMDFMAADTTVAMDVSRS